MPLPDLDHESYLRRTFAIAAAAAETGSHPFGAILVGGDGTVLMEQGNAYLPDHDMTGHAERVLATRASCRFPPAELVDATLYSSAEPCAMCAGAAYWAGIGRIVYGLSESTLRQITGNHPENPTLDLSCRVLLQSGQRTVDVIGPMLEDEAAELHVSFWASR